MLLAVRDVARHFGVEEEWERAAPELAKRLPRAEHAAATKGWRWIGEMEEIADTFDAAGQPDGFHRAAAEGLSLGDSRRTALAKRFGDQRVFAGSTSTLPAAASCS